MSEIITTQSCTNCGAELNAADRFCSKCGTLVKQDASGPTLSRFPIWIGLIGAIVLAGLAFLLLTALQPNSTGTTSVPDAHNAEGLPEPEVQRVPLVEAKASWDAKSAIFVDVRGQSDYVAGHIPNAVSLPLAQIEAGDSTLPRQAEILTYCT
jgi:hypothetical protein